MKARCLIKYAGNSNIGNKQSNGDCLRTQKGRLSPANACGASRTPPDGESTPTQPPDWDERERLLPHCSDPEQTVATRCSLPRPVQNPLRHSVEGRSQSPALPPQIRHRSRVVAENCDRKTLKPTTKTHETPFHCQQLPLVDGETSLALQPNARDEVVGNRSPHPWSEASDQKIWSVERRVRETPSSRRPSAHQHQRSSREEASQGTRISSSRKSQPRFRTSFKALMQN